LTEYEPNWQDCLIKGLCEYQLLDKVWTDATVPADISPDELKALL